MYRNRGIKAEISNVVKKLIIFKAFAEEPVKSDTTQTVNYEDLIAKARKEEKDKQFKNIERYKTQVETLTSQHNSDILRIAELEKLLTEANDKATKAGSGESEALTALRNEANSLKSENETLKQQMEEIKTNTVSREELEKEIRDKFEAEYAVKTYKAQKLAELKDDILIPDLVVGNTVEEIDKSIEEVLKKSEEIKTKLGVSCNKKKSDTRTPKAPANPTISPMQDKEISIEYLASLPVNSDEYKEVRKKLGLK